MKIDRKLIKEVIINNTLFLTFELLFIFLYATFFSAFIKVDGLYNGLYLALSLQLIIILLFSIYLLFKLKKIEKNLNRIFYAFLSYLLPVILFWLLAADLNNPLYALIPFVLPILSLSILWTFKIGGQYVKK